MDPTNFDGKFQIAQAAGTLSGSNAEGFSFRTVTPYGEVRLDMRNRLPLRTSPPTHAGGDGDGPAGPGERR